MKGDRCEVNVSELEVMIAAHQAAIASMARHEVHRTICYSDKSSLYQEQYALPLVEVDERRSRMLTAEVTRIRSQNEDLIVKIAAEGEKENGYRRSNEDFFFENPMKRLSGFKKFVKKAERSKEAEIGEAVVVATTADVLQRVEEERKGNALAAQIAEVLEGNASKASDLVAALTQRDLLVVAIAAEEELSFILQDRAVEVMEERSLRGIIALEEEKALELLIEASQESRDRFEAAAVLFEIEKSRAEAAEQSRVQISDAIASAVVQNALLSASLSLEGQKTIELQNSVAQAIYVRSSISSSYHGATEALTISIKEIKGKNTERNNSLAVAAEDTDFTVSPLSGSGTVSPKKWGKETIWQQVGMLNPDIDIDMDSISKSPTMAIRINFTKDISRPSPTMAMVGRGSLQSSSESPRLPRMDVIPAEQKSLSKGYKATDPKMKITSTMDNEAKMVADKMHNKRNAIRNAVNQALQPSQGLSKDITPPTNSIISSGSSTLSALDDTTVESTEALIDDSDQCSQSSSRIASHDLVSLLFCPLSIVTPSDLISVRRFLFCILPSFSIHPSIHQSIHPSFSPSSLSPTFPPSYLHSSSFLAVFHPNFFLLFE